MDKITGKILSIDDEAILRDSIVAYLEDSGFEVVEAENGQEGLEVFRREKPDLVLTDLQMPVMGGLEVLDNIIQESPGTPVIVVSGAGVMADAIEALRLGAWDYIVKPITDMTVLEHSVVKALERAYLIKQNTQYRKELEEKNLILKESLDELEADQEAGRQVQFELLPKPMEEANGYKIRHQIIPSLYLSGDFVDYYHIEGSKYAFYIADVSGHGASSAFVTVLLKSMLNAKLSKFKSGFSSAVLQPEVVLKFVSDELCKIRIGKYLTMIYCVLDVDKNTLTYSIGGHYPAPILFDGEKCQFLKGEGYAVGVYEGAQYSAHTIELPEKFLLTLFSDGVLELMNHANLTESEDRLLNCMKDFDFEPNSIFKNLHVELRQTTPDDITLLMLGKTG